MTNIYKEKTPDETGWYKVHNTSGVNNGEGRVYYDKDTGWDIPEAIKSFYNIVSWEALYDKHI